MFSCPLGSSQRPPTDSGDPVRLTLTVFDANRDAAALFGRTAETHAFDHALETFTREASANLAAARAEAARRQRDGRTPR